MCRLSDSGPIGGNLIASDKDLLALPLYEGGRVFLLPFQVPFPWSSHESRQRSDNMGPTYSVGSGITSTKF